MDLSEKSTSASATDKSRMPTQEYSLAFPVPAKMSPLDLDGNSFYFWLKSRQNWWRARRRLRTSKRIAGAHVSDRFQTYTEKNCENEGKSQQHTAGSFSLVCFWFTGDGLGEFQFQKSHKYSSHTFGERAFEFERRYKPVRIVGKGAYGVVLYVHPPSI